MKSADDKAALIHVLLMAYSGEKAAAFAYNAHWKSLRNADERSAIRQIEEEEWEHRAIVGSMLAELGATPQWWREIWMALIGKTVGLACYFIGWFLPMYFAGRLEHANVNEYDVAAQHADAIGRNDFAFTLRQLSVVELRHEQFFLNAITGHKWVPLLQPIFGWGASTNSTVAVTER